MKKSFYLLCATLLTFIPAHSQNRFKALAVASKLRTINVSELSANNSEKTVPTEFAYTKFDYVVEGKVEYDQYGRVIGLKQDESNYETITYEDDNSGKWTTQTISKVANGTENVRTQTARKFDKQGRITSFEQLVFNFDAQKWEPTHSLAYDYEHTDNEGVATVIKDITYSKYNNGTTCRTGYDSFWYEPNQGFLKSEYTPSHSQEYYLEGNVLFKTERTFDNIGNVQNVVYTKEETQENLPKFGYQTIFTSESTNNVDWYPISKIELTDGYLAYNIANDGKERIYQEYSYNKDLQKYELAKKQTCEWVNHPSLRLSKTCSWIEEEGETYYYVYYAPVNDDGTYGDFEDDFYLFQNGDYAFGHFGSNDDIYTFFNANGQETRKIRIRFNDENSFEIPSSADEFKNGEWFPLISEEVKVGELEDRFTFRTNDKGIVIWSEDHISDKLDLEVERTLIDNGYIEKSYGFSDQSGKKYLEEQITYTTLSDGSQENIDIEYDEDGNVTSKKKNILDTNGVRFQYSWDDTTNNWSPEQNTYVSSIITTASDGTKTTIYRRFQDGKIEEISKQVIGTTDNSTWVEEYSKEGDSWTPLHKTVKQNYQVPSFGIIAPKNPLPEFLDDKFFGGLNIIDGKKGIDELHYNWDANKKDWILQNIASDHKYEIETTSDPTTTITVYENGYGYKYCIDEQKRLRIYMAPSAIYMYDYNDERQLYKITDMTERGYQNIKNYILEYGKINVTDAIDKPNLSVRNNLIIMGRTIKAVDCHKILLYNLDGALISKSYEEGCVTAPSSGVYIVDIDGERTKILIK